jgi:type 1 glutamine amidotransferase
MQIPSCLSVSLTAAVVLAVGACGADGPSLEELNANRAGQSSAAGSGSTSGGSSSSEAGSSSVAGTGSPGTAGSGTAQGGSGTAGSGTSMGGSETTAGTGSGGSPTTGGTDAGGTGTGGTGTAGSGMGGSGGGAMETGPYAPRSGSFKMMVYSRQGPNGYRHTTSIATGKTMLTDIAKEQGFELVFVESDADNTKYITADSLKEFEIIFFLNSTSDIFNATQQKAYEDWMTQSNGAFAGVHSATDTENGWSFYAEVTGQYYNGHTNAGTTGQIQLESAMLSHPALKGVPNPWQRQEEWYKFDSWQQWSTKPGFKILGKKAADGQPIMWIREYGNWRSFYTAIGHDAPVFQDATVKKHVTGGIMWAVRRDHLIK